MSPRLRVSCLVIERLKKLPDNSAGLLLGVNNENSVFLIGISVSTQKKGSGGDKADSCKLDSICEYDLVPNLPANINVCGIFQASAGDETSDHHLTKSLLNNVKGTPVILNINLTSKKVTFQFYEDGLTKDAEYSTVDQSEIQKLFLHLRISAAIPLSCDFQYENIQESFNSIQKKITGNAAFHVESTDVFLLGEETEHINGISSELTVEKMFSEEKKSEDDINIFNVTMYMKSSNHENVPQLAPFIKYVKKNYKHVRIQLSVDSLAMVPKQLKIKHLYPVLVESVCRSLNLIEKNLLDQLNSGDVFDVSFPQTYHFLPPNCGHFISIVYPSKKTPEQLKNSRVIFHALLSLPMDRPLLRQGNAFDFSNVTQKKSDSNILLNPHEGLSKSEIPDGEPCFVQGSYAYYHYMQDKFDDSGWGCAYRSLQTVFSWFRFQGYTNMAVPTHKEIQQCLVNIGDKPSSFVGSNQWIGSTEVSFVLDTMLGVSCRIINVSSGEEMSVKGGELTYHFKTQGTPVMIGGGVLAHTIIGVDYNKKTGAIKFLILDPHYTGGEDLKIIQGKGWCGWKGPEFWRKDSFYNMCLPLRPKCV